MLSGLPYILDRFGIAPVLVVFVVLVALIGLALWVAVGILNRQK